jgi:hypothetical protein
MGVTLSALPRVTFVDVRPAFKGREICSKKKSFFNEVEGIREKGIGSVKLSSLHPNRAGQDAYVNAITAVVSSA